MTLFSLNSVASAASTRPTGANKPGGAATPTTSNAAVQTASRGTDSVELSGLFTQDASATTPSSGKPIRSDLVARIKSQIDSGTYDLDSKKLDKVATGILRDINLQG